MGPLEVGWKEETGKGNKGGRSCGSGRRRFGGGCQGIRGGRGPANENDGEKLFGIQKVRRYPAVILRAQQADNNVSFTFRPLMVIQWLQLVK